MRVRVYTDVDHIGSTIGGTIDIDICSTFAGLFSRHWRFLESVPNYLHFFSWKCLKNEPFCGCVVCVCANINIYINIWFCIFSTHDSGFFGLFSRDKSIHFRYFYRHFFAGNAVDIRHWHLQTSESTPVYTLIMRGGERVGVYALSRSTYTPTHIHAYTQVAYVCREGGVIIWRCLRVGEQCVIIPYMN